MKSPSNYNYSYHYHYQYNYMYKDNYDYSYTTTTTNYKCDYKPASFPPTHPPYSKKQLSERSLKWK